MTFPYYPGTKAVVYNGDCLEMMKWLPDNSVDAVVTDPPYSLTDRRNEGCASDMLRDAIVTDAAHDVTHLAEQFVPLRVTCGLSPLSVFGSVDLDAQATIRDEEVDRDAPLVRQDGEPLVDVGDPVPGQKGSGGEFRLWVRSGHSRCVAACRCLGKGSDGRIRVPVRLRYDALRQSQRPTGVVASRSAELAAVLALDVARGTAELLPASGADTLDPAFEVRASQQVGALARAGGLPPVLDSGRVGEVGDPTGGAVTFDLLVHRSVLSWRPTVLRGFMSSLWDGTGVETDLRVWRECLRVLKPGGHLLAFGAPRTWHNLQTAIERSGFEIRDSIAWLTGSGFPKSLDVSKAIDKANGRRFEDRFALGRHIRERRELLSVPRAEVNSWLNSQAKCEHYESSSPSSARVPTLADFVLLQAKLGLSDEFLPLVMRIEAERSVTGAGGRSGQARNSMAGDFAGSWDATAPATEAAQQWQGWGTALKPAFEPIVVGRKPLAGTVAQTVLAHGTGALNIDGSRIATTNKWSATGVQSAAGTSYQGSADGSLNVSVSSTHEAGRWPTNVILDGHVAAELDQQTGTLSSGSRAAGTYGLMGYMGADNAPMPAVVGDSGGASRFFPVFKYQAKAPAKERPRYWRKSCSCETVKPCPSQPGATTESESADDRSWSTSMPGSRPTDGPFHPAMTSTTETATSSTTPSVTSNSSPSSSTNGSTPGVNYETASGGSPAPSAENSSQFPTSIGTSVLKDGRSTVAADPATSDGWSETSVCANCGAVSRHESHATVKPLELMRWLVRLVTPPDGVVLEPFAGSGTTVEAALLEGFHCVAIEREAEYLPLIFQRIYRATPGLAQRTEPEGLQSL